LDRAKTEINTAAMSTQAQSEINVRRFLRSARLGLTSMATVLVVDDEFGIAELFDAILVDEGHRVLTASNGKHGLEVLAHEKPDLVFLDT
jgi:PleD family two-component response regulator